MKRKTLSLAIGCVLMSPIAMSPLAWAQDTGSDTSTARTLDTVTVTARKREETLQEVPVAVTAFTAETLDKLNVEDLSDLDAQVPNLTIYAARGSSSTITAYIRGVGQSDPLWGVDPGVGLYLDDVYIARPQGALLDVFDVERVEVLRGPQGTLYGKNTIGGAIKYISRGLSPNFGGYGQVTIGNYGQRDVKAAVGGGLGGNDALRARIAVADLHRDGFGENLITGDDVSDKDITAFRLNVGAYVTDAFDLQFAFDHMDDTSGVRGAKMLEANRFDTIFSPTTGPFLPLDDRYDVRNGMPNINNTDMLGVSMTANYRMDDDWTFKYVWAKRESDTETNIDFDLTPDKIADVKAFYSDEQVSNELQVNYDAGGRMRGVFGVYGFDAEAGGQVLNNFFNLVFGDTQGVVYTESVAVYADWTFDITEKLKLDVGARYTDEDKHAVVLNRGYTDDTFTRLNGVVAANFDKAINFKNFSPKVSLDYQITPDIMVYGLASRGFKSGGYNIRAQATAAPRSAEPFDDEQVDSFEVGTKMGLLDQTLFLNLAAFHNRYKDIQLSVFTALPDGTFFGDFTNAGSGTVNGFELEYQWLPSEHWLISGNLAWLDAKYDEFLYFDTNPAVRRTVDIADEQEFTNAPKFSGALNVEWRTDLGNGGNLSARVGYAYQSEVVATTEILRASRPPVAPFGRPPITEDGYGLVNAGVIWQVNDAWRLSLQGTNLADKEYRTTGYNLNQAIGTYTGFYGPPRQYTLSARFEF
ncbi:MAG: TonB-dependent receptor [Pseudomonadota bacterium]|nr:TonB-dependent receptor [Pseudomonadota bacterium]